MAEDKFHCIECAGFAKARGEECLTCDGEGNAKVAKPIEKPKTESKKKAKK